MTETQKTALIIFLTSLLFSCKEDGDITVVTGEPESEISLDSMINAMTGTFPVTLKRTPINPAVVGLGDENYEYELTVEHLLGNKVILISTYEDIGDELNIHELEISISKIIGSNAFLNVDPLWNYIEPNNRTYVANGTGSFIYDGVAYDGVFDLESRSMEVKFEGTIASTSRVYIISSVNR